MKTQRNAVSDNLLSFEKTVIHVSTVTAQPFPESDAEETRTTSLPFWLIRLQGKFALAAKFKLVSP